MIITLNPNTAIDYTLQVEDFQLNHTLRATGAAWGMGGKAADASWILGNLGIPSRALGFAAGANGQRMESMLRARGVETDFVQVQGETRLNAVIVVTGEGQSTITSSSLEVAPDHVSELTSRYQNALENASCVVMGGSLPHGVPAEFYEKSIAQAHAKGVPVIFDSSGPALMAGLKSRPDLVKPNRSELGELLGPIPTSHQAIQQAARHLHEQYGTNVIVTLGEEGAIAVCEEDSFFVHPLNVTVVSAAGAGDGVLAGMALAYERRESFEYGLKQGFALAAAILKTLGTADFRLEDYRELLPQIRIERL